MQVFNQAKQEEQNLADADQQELVLLVEDAIGSIVESLQSDCPKRDLNELILPHLQLLNNEHLCLTADTFAQLFPEIGIPLADHQVESLMKILVRDIQTH